MSSFRHRERREEGGGRGERWEREREMGEKGEMGERERERGGRERRERGRGGGGREVYTVGVGNVIPVSGYRESLMKTWSKTCGCVCECALIWCFF